jgi:hypothetical protein
MKLFFIGFCILILFSCRKSNDISGIDYTQWPISKVEGPIVANAKELIELKVYWPYSSGCDILDKFEIYKTGNIINIIAYGHTAADVCTQDAGLKTRTYNFSSTVPGVFELRFLNKDNSYITHIVTIN